MRERQRRLIIVKLEIARQANLLEEAYWILYQLANDENVAQSKEIHSGYLKSKPEEYSKTLDLVSEMFRYVQSNIKTEWDRVVYYFKKRGQDFDTFALLALVPDYQNTSDEIPSFRERMEALRNDRIKRFATCINAEEAVSTPEEKLKTLEDLIAFIDASEYDDAVKWETISIFNNQETHYNEASRILNEVKELLSKKYSSLIAEIAENFYRYWSSCQEKQDIIDTMKERLKVSWDVSEKGCRLAPAIFLPFLVSVNIDSDLDGKDIVHLGILYDIDFNLSNEKIKKEDLVEIRKLLSDRSKVDILEFVSRKPSYGKEKQMNCSFPQPRFHTM